MDLLITLFSWTLSLTVGVILALHILGPLLVWKQQGMTGRYALEKLPGAEFLAERNAEFQGWHADLLALGFDYLGSSALTLSHAKTFVSLYRHANGLAGTVATSANKLQEVSMLEFTQLYADGSVLSVSNIDQVAVYPRIAFKEAYRLPAMRDARLLLTVALQQRERHHNSARTVLTPGREFEEVGAYLNREQDELIQRGYLARELRPDGLRGLTLKGAFLFSWKLLWPTRPLLDAWQCRQASRMLLQP